MSGHECIEPVLAAKSGPGDALGIAWQSRAIRDGGGGIALVLIGGPVDRSGIRRPALVAGGGVRVIPVEFERVELREGRGVIWVASTAQHDGPAFRLPVWVGEHEAALVQIAAEGRRSPRPLTIDVLRQVLLAFDLRLEGAAITAAREGLLHAELTVGSGTRRRTIDCRPSDALALALRERAPIAVAPDVARAQGLPPA